jgi:hypothetical protein
MCSRSGEKPSVGFGHCMQPQDKGGAGMATKVFFGGAGMTVLERMGFNWAHEPDLSYRRRLTRRVLAHEPR